MSVPQRGTQINMVVLSNAEEELVVMCLQGHKALVMAAFLKVHTHKMGSPGHYKSVITSK